MVKLKNISWKEVGILAAVLIVGLGILFYIVDNLWTIAIVGGLGVGSYYLGRYFWRRFYTRR